MNTKRWTFKYLVEDTRTGIRTTFDPDVQDLSDELLTKILEGNALLMIGGKRAHAGKPCIDLIERTITYHLETYD